MNDLKILALIPARGGSKRLPGKNIKNLAGKPLIAWTIEAALQSKFVDTVMVSTDCEEVASVAKQYGANVPFIRPTKIAGDETGMLAVVDHTLDFYKIQGQVFTHILLLQPTSPLRSTADIDGAIQLLITKEAKAVYGVCEADHSPLWMNTLPEDKSFDEFLKPEIAGLRSQDLPAYYRLNGAIFLLELEAYQKEKAFYSIPNSYAYVMDRQNSIDIDDEVDFATAQALLESR